MSEFPYLDSLNPAQREAVLHTGGPLLILAGAGSGKTRVITVKIAYLITQLGVDPRSIMAVTFTNKAAAEMRERACAMAAGAAEVMIRTFHSFGAWLLRRNAASAGLDSSFSIYDDDDAVSLLRTLYPEEHRGTLTRYSRLISRAKDYGLSPNDDLTPMTPDPELPPMYLAYQRRLEEIGNVDFGDLIERPVRLLRADGAIRERTHQRFRYILVDEYQDSNVAQYELLKTLADETTYLCVVGDDDQSIYKFRGAEVRNILTFGESFPGTTIVRLEQNYRSTESILNVASAVVKNNEGRLGKTLWTDRSGGMTPVVALLQDQDDEVEYCLRLIRQSERKGGESQTAILYRTNAQSRLFESAFLREEIPYRIVGSVRFYEREEIKDALALLRLFANPRDEVAFRRVVNKPARGIGGVSIEKIIVHQHETSGDLLEAGRVAIAELPKRAAGSLREFLKLLDDARGAMSGGQLSTFVEHVVRESGLWEYHGEQHDEITARGKIENLEELANAASLYSATGEGLAEFLEIIELDRAREEDETVDARVTLITMHNTKGLEFDRVIVTGLEEGLFPRGGDEGPDEIEEERRLFYVAVTRAREELYFTSCSYRRVHGRTTDFVPSRFLGEIPPDLVSIDGGEVALRDEVPDLYPVGSYVYHDDYGTGIVGSSWYSGSELVVQVRFETGQIAKFLPKYVSLERVQP